LKRRNFSTETVKNYLNGLKQFLVWVDVPIEQVDYAKVLSYIDFQLDRGRKPKTINCHLSRIRLFYDFLRHEQGLKVDNPVKRGLCLRMPRPLPKHLKDEQAERLLDVVSKPRDRALLLLMLRSGLRVAELAHLTFEAVDFRRGRLWVRAGKGNKDRVVYVSPDAMRALVDYLRCRPKSNAKRLFLVEKGACRGQPLSVRGIQKRMEYHVRKAGLASSCHHLRHTMATQMLNAGAELSTIQDLLGHRCVTTTQQYCRVSNLKVQKDYYEAMEKVMKRTATRPLSR